MRTWKLKSSIRQDGKKQCEGCMEFKPATADFFYMYPSNSGPRPRNVCIVCHVKKSTDKYAADPEPKKEYVKQWTRDRIKENPRFCSERKLKAKLKRHGATMEWYEAQRAKQKDLCEICGQPEKSKGTAKHFDGGIRLSIDHNHLTNAVRGLLCQECNVRLATLEMSDWLPKAIAYLAKY